MLSQESGTSIAACGFDSLYVNFAFTSSLPVYTTLAYGDLLTLESGQNGKTLHILHYHSMDTLNVQIRRNYYLLNDKIYGGQISSIREFAQMSKLVRYIELVTPFSLISCREFPDKMQQVRIFKSRFIQDDHLQTLLGFENVRFLDLESAPIDARGFKKKSGLRKLMALNLARTFLNNEGLANIPDLPDLKYINLSATKVDKTGLKELVRFPKLKCVYLEKNHVEISSLEKLSGLQTLNLNDANVEPKELQKLVMFSKLEHLYLKNAPIDNLAFIAELKKLKELSLQKTNSSNQSLQYLAELSTLDSLDISETNITDQGLEFLAKNNLKKLSLYGNNLGTMSHIAKLDKLEELNLAHTTFEGNFTLLEKLKELTLINLQNINIDEQLLETIGKLKKLKTLNLSMTNVNDSGISHLRQLSNLQFLYLSATKISSKSIETIACFYKLSILDIRYTKIGFRGLYRLKQALPDCHIYHSWWNIIL